MKGCDFIKQEKLSLEELAKAERRTYEKAWRIANPDKVKVYNQKYWEKKAMKRLENQAKGGDKH